MKWIKRGLVALVVLVVLVFAVVIVFLNPLARRGVVAAATYATGTEVTLDSLEIGLVSGTLSMTGLDIANPPGFDTPHFFTMDHTEARVKPRSLLGHEVNIPLIDLRGIDLNLEEKNDRANYLVINEHLQQLGGDGKPEETKGGKTFVIERLVIADVQAHAVYEGRPITFEIPSIELENIGSDGRGVDLEVLSGVILDALLGVLKKQAGQLLPLLARSAVGEGLKGIRSLGDVVVKNTGEVTAVFKDTLEKVPLLDQAGKTLEKAARGLTEGTGNAVEKATDALGGLFGGKKKSKTSDKEKKDDGGQD